MRTFLRSKAKLLFMSLGMLLAVAGAALADNIRNDIGSGGVDTIVAGNSTTISYYIQDTGGTCDAADGSKATVNISVPAGVTASKSSLTFDKCGIANKQGIDFSSNTVGDYPITVSSVSDTSGSYTTPPANFTLHVTSPPPPATLRRRSPFRPA